MDAKPELRERYDPETARTIRLLLERIAGKIERLAGCGPYQTAWKKAAKIVRESKPD